MKNKFLQLAIGCLFTFSVFSQPISNCPASPELSNIKQPDGTNLTIKPIGSLYVSYTETEDGYTLLENPKNGFEYAVQNGQDLNFTGVLAHNVGSRSQKELDLIKKTPKNLRYGKDYVSALLAQVRQQDLAPNGSKEVTTEVEGFPHTGNRRVLMILIDFKDLKHSYDSSSFWNLMNQNNYGGTGSYKDYYKTVSFNKLNLTIDVYGWYTTSNSYKNYGRKKGNAAVVPLVGEAIDDAEKKGVNFANYDNDKDGKVDGVLIVHGGQGAEETGSQTSDYIWSHRWNLGSSYRTYDGKTISDYNIQPEVRTSNGAHMVGIGVFCHEFGHILGLPDLYDTDYKTEGDGVWCLMAGGSWVGGEKTPSTYSAFSRTWLGWITPTNITSSGTYSLRPVVESGQVYKIKTSVSTEYYLLENRQYKSYDAKLPGKGMAIWHVDASIMTSSSSDWYNNMVNVTVSHKGLDLEEADGKNDLDNYKNSGDAGDLYPGSSNNTKFSDLTTPDAKTYNGNKTNITISAIKQNADSSVTFNFGSVPTASFSTSSSSLIGCAGKQTDFVNNSSFASSFVWNFGDGTDSTIVTNPSHTYTKAGSFKIKLKATSGSTTVYDSQTIIIYDNGIADFIIDSIVPPYIYLTNKSTNISSFQWSWGDGNVSYFIKKNVSHKYTDAAQTHAVTLMGYNSNGCNDSMTKSILLKLSGTSGINEASNNYKLNVFPNPFSNSLNMNFVLSKASFVETEVVNMLGQSVSFTSSATYPLGENNINISLNQNLPSGVYMAIVKIDNQPFVVKLIKN
ncbi:MAG: M6 family metalloprotease domain-containing protein [Bacteroidetes bacterium]|nr:M6 family metalloprotease domain-containing protein [Bacteroidota bacterium]